MEIKPAAQTVFGALVLRKAPTITVAWHEQVYLCLEFNISNFTSRIVMASASFKCSFRCFSNKECDISKRYKHNTVLVPLKSCTKDVSAHLNGCYKTPSSEVEVEWKLCLFRVGLFDEEGDSFTICPLHRDEYGLGWRPSKVCKYPMHDNKQKPQRGVTKRMSQEIYGRYNILCEIGQGW